MEIKAFFKKLANLTYRLHFYCLGFVVLYYCLKYLIFYPDELNSSANTQDCMIIALIQLIYWAMTAGAEQISNKIFSGEWNMQYFTRYRSRIKVYILFYIMATLAMGYFFANSFFEEKYSSRFNFNSSDANNTLSKIIYGSELGISVSLSSYLVYIYQIMSRPQEEPLLNRQQYLPNVSSINPGDEEGVQQLLQQIEQQINNNINNNPNQNIQANQQQQLNRAFNVNQSFAQQEGSFFFDQEKICSICYEECLENDRILELPCRHTYHSHCVRQLPQKICPLCRAPF